MKKQLLIVAVLLFLTGCSAKYNIKIVDDKVYESISANVNNKTEQAALKYLKNNEFYAQIVPNLIKYDKKSKENGEITEFDFSHEYEFDDYKNSNILSTCFKGHSIIKENDTLLLSTSKGVKCMKSDNSKLIDNIDIEIESNHKMIDNNADEIKGNTYIWHIDEDNYEEKNIMLKLDVKKKIYNYEGNITKLLLIIGIPSLIIIVAILIVLIKRKRMNQI